LKPQLTASEFPLNLIAKLSIVRPATIGAAEYVFFALVQYGKSTWCFVISHPETVFTPNPGMAISMPSSRVATFQADEKIDR